MAVQHKEIKVKGRVQGVFFRASTRDTAVRLGIKGWVKNERDGSVLIEAEGPEHRMNKFLQWCHQGPPAALITEVEYREGKLRDYKDFKLRW